MAIYLDIHTGARVPPTVIADTQAQRLVCEAKALIGQLTILAGAASTVDEALRLYRAAHAIEQAALGAVRVALHRADTVCGQH